MFYRRLEGEGGVDRRDHRQRDRVKRRAAVKAQRRNEGERHQQPGERANRLRCAIGEEREQRRREIGECHAEKRADQSERRIAKLGVGGAHDHAADVAKSRIGTEAHHACRQAEPDRALALQERGERAIVDQRVLDRGEATCLCERLAMHEHGAAGRRRDLPLRIVHPGEGVEHLEEEHEGRNEPALRKALAAEFYHQRGQHRLLRKGALDEALNRVVGLVGDVGVGKEQEAGRRRLALDVLDALAHREELAGPAGRRLAAGDDGEAILGAQSAGGGGRRFGRAVGALVVDQHDREFSRIALAEERADAERDDVGFVAGGNDCRDVGPGRNPCRAIPSSEVIVPLGASPEEAPSKKQVEPDRQCGDGEQLGAHWRSPFFSGRRA